MTETYGEPGGRADVPEADNTRHRTARPASQDPTAGALADLENKNISELRSLWGRRFRAPVPPIQSAEVLRRLIAWKVQVEQFGDLDRETASRLARLKSALARGKNTLPSTIATLRPGTMLTREWRGRVHRVLVCDEGYEYDGTRYRSLSEIARTITGPQWSGPRFFGLEVRKAKPGKTGVESCVQP